MRSMQKANSPCNFPSENHHDHRKTPIKTGFDNPNKAAKTGSDEKLPTTVAILQKMGSK